MFIRKPHNICTKQNFRSEPLIKKQRLKHLKLQKGFFFFFYLLAILG